MSERGVKYEKAEGEIWGEISVIWLVKELASFFCLNR